MKLRHLLPLLLAVACSTPPARVLILTGEDAHHRWQETTPVLKGLLEEDPRLEVEVLDELGAIANKDLAPYDVVVVHFKNDDAALPGRAAFDKLNAYVRGGGGLVLPHFACGAFQEFRDDYEALIGRVWFGAPPPNGGRQHDPYGEFEVRVIDSTHAVTAGMESFTTSDELYTCLTGSGAVQVLLDAVSRLDGQPHPMAMVREADAGRVFLCTLGHDVPAYQTKAVGELYRRGTAWAAGL